MSIPRAVTVLLIVGCSGKNDSSPASYSTELPAAAPKTEPTPKPKTGAKKPKTVLEITIDHLRARLDNSPYDARSMIRLGKVYRMRALQLGSLGDHFEAARLAEMAVELDPRSVDAVILRGQARLSLHRTSAAYQDARRALALAPDNADAALLRISVDMESGRLTKAKHRLEEATEKRQHPYLIGRQAEVERRLGNFAAAFRLYEHALKAAGNDPTQQAWVHVQRAISHREHGDFDAASQDIQAALRVRPSYHPALELWPQLERLTGNLGAAKQACAAALAQGRDVELLSIYAWVLAELGDEKQARDVLQEATDSYEDLLAAFPEALARHGALFYLRHGQNPRRALDLARKAVDARPTAESYRVLAEAQMAGGTTEDARAAIQKALDSPERSGRIFWTAARVMEAAGDPAAAAHLESKALKLNPRVQALAL